MITTVLFDLDGTLLPMDQDKFVNGYFGFLVQKAAGYGYEAKKLIRTVWEGTAAMVRNDGSVRNEEAFWRHFCSVYGEEARKDIPMFNEFYAVEFQQARSFCGYSPKSAEAVNYVLEQGAQAVLATNPLFPAVATESRMRWAGVEPEQFSLYTTYENIGYCKPNLDYYREILQRLHLRAEECLMVGNDTGEDMITEQLGMQVFLLTDCLINKSNADIHQWPHGDFDALLEHLRRLLGAENNK